uniref:Uncharacterized protein n=1 Tax=viral metagenome TaxID=1070528 RepID=A0A6M3JL54_9ZZZZ
MYKIPQPYRREDVMAKMFEQEVINFSEAELDRVFADTASPIACKRAVERMVEAGLTVEELYATFATLEA